MKWMFTVVSEISTQSVVPKINNLTCRFLFVVSQYLSGKKLQYASIFRDFASKFSYVTYCSHFLRCNGGITAYTGASHGPICGEFVAVRNILTSGVQNLAGNWLFSKMVEKLVSKISR